MEEGGLLFFVPACGEHQFSPLLLPVSKRPDVHSFKEKLLGIFFSRFFIPGTPSLPRRRGGQVRPANRRARLAIWHHPSY